MHEAAIAEALLKTILDVAGGQRGRPLAARISCGQFAAVNPEALCFAFDALAKGTRCEGMRLQVEIRPVEARCSACGRIWTIDDGYSRCPNCSSQQFSLLPEPPLLLESVDFEDKTDE
ncbi:MAG: hydrogenase maturation nickel metallochaperone HypA [Sedimentisphaerales bacterium]|jgi:hydrogenase nickel incorporation protein HypA/HybF|nr:hydrogenase maturation nickel metallochaperone HypA [Sedimentisphaerales bacterium]